MQAERGTVSALQRRYFARNRVDPARNNERKEQANRIKKRVQSHRGNTQETLDFFMQLNTNDAKVGGSRDLVGLQPAASFHNTIAKLPRRRRIHKRAGDGRKKDYEHRRRDHRIMPRIPTRRSHAVDNENVAANAQGKRRKMSREPLLRESPSMSRFAPDVQVSSDQEKTKSNVPPFSHQPKTEIRLYDGNQDRTAFFREHRAVNSSFFAPRSDTVRGRRHYDEQNAEDKAQANKVRESKPKSHKTTLKSEDSLPKMSRESLERSRFWNIPPAVQLPPETELDCDLPFSRNLENEYTIPSPASDRTKQAFSPEPLGKEIESMGKYARDEGTTEAMRSPNLSLETDNEKGTTIDDKDRHSAITRLDSLSPLSRDFSRPSASTSFEPKLNFISDDDSSTTVGPLNTEKQRPRLMRLPQPPIKPCDISAELAFLERKLFEIPDPSTKGRFLPKGVICASSKNKNVQHVADLAQIDKPKNLIRIPSPMIGSEMSKRCEKGAQMKSATILEVSYPKLEEMNNIVAANRPLNSIPSTTYPVVADALPDESLDENYRPATTMSFAAVSVVNNPIAMARNCDNMRLEKKNRLGPSKAGDIDEDNLSIALKSHCSVSSSEDDVHRRPSKTESS